MKRLARLLTVGIMIFAPMLARTAYAASSTLYLSPSSGSVSNGYTLTVSVRENSGSEPVNAVKADLTYPTNLLTFVSISSSNAFGITAQNSGGSGSVHIDRGANPAVSGDQLVATVRFKAKASSGTATISFSSSSAVISANSNTNIKGAANGGSYTLKTPPVASSQPAAPVDKTPPTIKDVKAGDIKINSAVVSWTTSEPASSEVDYGINSSYGLTSVDSNYVTAHKVTLNSALLSPGVTYHFRVKSTDPSGNAASSPDATFTTKGASLLVTVTNQDNRKVSGAKVAFGSHSGTTGSNGQVTIQGLTIGKQTGTVTYGGKQTVVSVNVSTPSSNGKPQEVSFKIQTTNTLGIWIVAAGILILLLGAAALFLRRKGGGGTPGGSLGGGNPISKIKSLFSRNKSSQTGGSAPGTGSSAVVSPAPSSTEPANTGPTIIKPSQ